MSLILSGTDGLSDIDGSAATPAIRGTDANTGIFFPAADTIAFAEGGVESMRIDSAGNVGIGTTTPTFAAGGGIQNKNATFASFRATGGASTGIDFAQGSDAKGYVFNRDNADIIFGTNSAERMRILSSGEVGIGASSPEANAKLTVYGAGIAVSRDASTVAPSGFDFKCRSANPKIGLHVTATAQLAQIEFGTAGDNSFGALINVTGVDPLRFGTNNTERARITSTGNLLVGTTSVASGGGVICAVQSANLVASDIRATNASFTSSVINLEASRNTTNTSYYFFSGTITGIQTKIRIADSGNVTNVNGSYGTISDAKLKTDIVDAGSQWADIKAIRFRKFKMIDDPDQRVQLGVIAQEIEQVSAGLIEEHTDRDADENDLGTTTKSVKTSVLLMKAAVALQEAMTRIEQLEADVATLKGVQ